MGLRLSREYAEFEGNSQDTDHGQSVVTNCVNSLGELLKVPSMTR